MKLPKRSRSQLEVGSKLRPTRPPLQQFRQFVSVTELSIHNSRCRSKGMWLSFVCTDNMNDFGPLRLQIIGNQAAMAFPPDGFCTHDRHRTPLLCRFLQARYSRDKFRCLHVVSVTAKGIVSPSSVAGILARPSPATQFREMLITNAGVD